MPSALNPITEGTVMSNVDLDQVDFARRMKYVGLGPDDLENLAAIRDLITKNAGLLVDAFFGQLAGTLMPTPWNVHCRRSVARP
jgi:hypothetical protein